MMFSQMMIMTISTLLSIVTAIPMDNTLAQRDVIQCQTAYLGAFELAHYLLGRRLANPNENVIYNTGLNALVRASDNTVNPLRVQFDSCHLNGWDYPGLYFGQVKPQQDPSYCLTFPNSVGANEFTFQPCANTPGDLLKRQWFRADYDTAGYLAVVYTGNYNDHPDVGGYIRVDYTDHSKLKLEHQLNTLSTQLIFADLTEIGGLH